MKKLNVIIVDDEPNCVDTLVILLRNYNNHINILATAGNAQDATAKIILHQDNLDILFLDIEMPGADGFKLLDDMEQTRFKVIFTTAHEQYALKAIKFSAFDYLLKPIDNDELSAALTRYREEEQALYPKRIQPVTIMPDHIAISSHQVSQFVKLDEILYMQSDNNYTTIYTTKKEQLISSKNIGHYEEMLAQHHFYRIHNSYLVNLRKVTKYYKGKSGYLELENGMKIEISTRRKEEVLQILGLA